MRFITLEKIYLNLALLCVFDWRREKHVSTRLMKTDPIAHQKWLSFDYIWQIFGEASLIISHKISIESTAQNAAWKLDGYIYFHV